jgi:hypothetical protein
MSEDSSYGLPLQAIFSVIPHPSRGYHVTQDKQMEKTLNKLTNIPNRRQMTFKQESRAFQRVFRGETFLTLPKHLLLSERWNVWRFEHDGTRREESRKAWFPSLIPTSSTRSVY